MVNLFGDGFCFVATEPAHQERLSMGYADMNKAYPFVTRSYEDDASYREAMQLGRESDVVIIGSAPELFVKKRIAESRLTFRYSERIFKRQRWRILDPRMLKSLIWHHTRHHKKRLYMLCASAYTAEDFALIGAYKNKCYKWGYFSEVKEYDFNALMEKKREGCLSLLWAGRFLDWKHPEKALYVAKYLKDHGIDFSLKIIGGGKRDGHLKSIVHSLHIEDCVQFLGYLPPVAVRKEMEMAEIFLFTSDYNEGWGVVLNEAMNSGCAVLCSHAIGAVPYLVKDKVNGLIYSNNSINDLCQKALNLAQEPELRSHLGRNAYKTMHDCWSANVAATRLIKLAECLLMGNEEITQFADGPCSIASPTGYL